MIRLNNRTRKDLPGNVTLPGYNNEACKTGIIHLGIGAFLRAHLAVYTDTAMGIEGGDWGICGVSLRSPGVRDQLAPQDNLFIVAEKTETKPSYRLIGSVNKVIFAPDDPKGLIRRMADPDIKIVSLTITEKGYLHDPAKGRLNPSDEGVLHDLAHPQNPRTAIGYLVRSLEERRRANTAPFTVLSCDNLPENGTTLKRVVLDFAALIDEDLALWIKDNVSFPCTMVDRIVPVATEEDRKTIENDLSLCDKGVVVTEPFCQWVVEDCFPEGRPAWEKAGVIFSSEVKNFETMKLRFLNGAHSAMAYLGYLSGKFSISECMECELKTLIKTLMQKEILPTVITPEGYNAENYIDELLERFSNPGLRHKTWTIAMDGSQKLPQRLLDTIRDQINSSEDITILTLAVAAWMRFVCGVDEKGDLIEISDPLAQEYVSRTRDFKKDPDKTIDALLELKKIFGDDLPENELFCSHVKKAFTSLCTLGAKKTIERLVKNPDQGI